METEIPRVLALLKTSYRSKRIRYKDVAARLEVSEPTIKRYFSGRGLTLDTLERLCQVAGLKLSDLHELLAADTAPANGRLTLAQEQGLTRDLFAAFVLYLLRSGWKAQDIAEEFALSEERMFKLLRMLEKLKLLDILAQNKVRLRVNENPDWLPDGPIRRAFDRSMHAAFQNVDYHSPSTLWELETIKVSPGALKRLKAAIDAFAKEVRELGESRPDAGSMGWYSILCTARPVDLPAIFDAGKTEKN